MIDTTANERSARAGLRKSTWLLLTGVAVVVGLGILKLNLPFHNDQATFANYARMMNDGAALYLDVWDPKPPGVFYFFMAGGRLFGFSEAGVHLLELLYLTAGSVVGALWLRRRLINGTIAFWYPLLTAGWFYLLARWHDPGQVEVLAGPLILGHIILSLPSAGGEDNKRIPAGRLLLAGILVGLLGWLKLLLTAIPAIVALTVAITSTRRDTHRAKSIVRYLGWQLAGVAIPILGLVVWFSATGALDTLWYTMVTYPISVLADQSETVLNKLVFRSFVLYLPLVALGGLALMRRSKYPKSRDLFLVAVVAAVTSAVVVMSQTRWTYQANLAIFPVAILAVFGIDQIVEMPRRRRTVFTLIAIATLIPAAVVETPRLLVGLEHRFGYGGQAREYQSAIEPQYEALLDALDQVDMEPDDLVFGTDNRIVWLSQREQAIPISPWLTVRGTPELTARALQQLAETPADWIFIDRWADGLESTHQLREALARDYRVVAQTDNGEWLAPVD